MVRRLKILPMVSRVLGCSVTNDFTRVYYDEDDELLMHSQSKCLDKSYL
jgi:hypothetical protein